MHNMRKLAAAVAGGVVILVAWSFLAQSNKTPSQAAPSSNDQMITNNAQVMLEKGREIFRYDTFGDETYWGETLRLHQAIAGEKQGGVGPGVSPKTALAVGLKVHLDALPANLVDQLKAGKVNLDDPKHYLGLAQAQLGCRRNRSLRPTRKTGVDGNSVRLLPFPR